jgi:hypothetical protein
MTQVLRFEDSVDLVQPSVKKTHAFVNVLALQPFGLTPAALVASGLILGDQRRR